MDLIDRIGAVLGLAAFLGLAVLALLYFQQARDVRRLRVWAGKAPERAAAAAEEAGVVPPEPSVGFPSRALGRVRSGLARIGAPIASAWAAIDRRSPVDPRVLFPVLALGAIAAVVFLAHPFGLLEGETGGSGGDGHNQPTPPDQIEVAVLNGTATPTAPGVPGLANQVGEQVKSAGYKLGPVGDTSTSFPQSVVMFAPDSKAEATALAEALNSDLGALKAEPMTTDISNLAGGAIVAIVVGQDDVQP
jgi:hypothetical protein